MIVWRISTITVSRVSVLAGVGCRHIQHNANVDSVTAGHRRETRGAPYNQLGSFKQSLDKLANEKQIQIIYEIGRVTLKLDEQKPVEAQPKLVLQVLF